MKLTKKILSISGLVLALCILSSQITFASDVKTSQEAADALNKLGLFQGTGNGYELEKSLTRAEAVTMIVRLLGEEEAAIQTKLEHPFTDVPEWASPYVGYAFAHNITKGVSETQFDSNSKVTLQQFLTFVLRILEYKDGNVDFVWNAPEDLAMEVGLISSINIGEFLRGDMVKICLNALNASYKNTSLPMYKMLVERDVFTSSQYKTALGIKNITESKEILTATFDFIGKEKIDSKFLLQAIEMIKIDEKNVNDILNVDYNLMEINYSIK